MSNYDILKMKGGETMDKNKLFMHTEILQKALDYTTHRHKFIASNIANINTKKYIPFDLLLKKTSDNETIGTDSGQMLHKTHSKHLEVSRSPCPLPTEITPCPTNIENGGDNWVDIDAEMYKLSSNGLKFSVLSKMLGNKFSQLRSIIQERNI